MQEYNLEQDHKAIKRQIKEWEVELDSITNRYRQANRGNDCESIIDKMSDDIEAITEEMMSINI